MARRKYTNRPPGLFGTKTVPPLEIIELRGRRELSGEPLPPPAALISVESIEFVEAPRIVPKPLIPTAAELAALPAAGQIAVAELYERATTTTRADLPPAERVRQAAFLLVEASTDRDPVGRRLKSLRRQFDALVAGPEPPVVDVDLTPHLTAEQRTWPVARIVPPDAGGIESPTDPGTPSSP